MDELMRLAAIQAMVDQLDAAANTARRMRATALYDYVADPSVNRRELCRQLGISSPRLYQIMAAEEARRYADDEATEGMLLEFAHEDSLGLWEDAVDRWQQAGEVGTPDDYFDLNALHVRRA